MKELADHYFNFDKSGKKFSKWVENTVGKGEIACNKQFLLFPQFFSKTCKDLFGKGLSSVFTEHDLYS